MTYLEVVGSRGRWYCVVSGRERSVESGLNLLKPGVSSSSGDLEGRMCGYDVVRC